MLPVDATFLRVIGAVLVGTVALIAAAIPLCIGRERARLAVGEWRHRLRLVAPYLLVLGGILLLNKGTQVFVVELSLLINVDLTSLIYDIEGEFVATFQAALPTLALHYFAFIYVIGYVFLLVFPLIAYFALPSVRRLKELLVAYGINYGLGVFSYTLFIAYGPRNMMPDTVRQPLFELYPETFLLTSAVNANTNVFPSLHTSLAVTVLLFAWLTRAEYPVWTAIATIFAASVVLSTMALGIHWLIDVLAGVLLAVLAVTLADPLVDRIDPLARRGGARLETLRTRLVR